jgi:hypothetical protein
MVDFIEIGSRLGWPLFGPPGMPADRLEVLRAAFTSLMADAVFAREFEDTVKGELNPTSGADLARFVDRALNTPTSTLDAAKTILGID